MQANASDSPETMEDGALSLEEKHGEERRGGKSVKQLVEGFFHGFTMSGVCHVGKHEHAGTRPAAMAQPAHDAGDEVASSDDMVQ